MLFYNLGQYIQMENQTLFPQPPKIKDGKMVHFGSCLTPSLILGDGGLLFHFIQSKIVANCELLLSKANPLGQKNIFSFVQTTFLTVVQTFSRIELYIFPYFFLAYYKTNSRETSTKEDLCILSCQTNLHHSCVLSSLDSKKSSCFQYVTQTEKIFLAKLGNFLPGADLAVSVVKLQTE